MTSGMSDAGQGKPKILGKPHSLSDEEAADITQMIVEAQQSSRQRTIPTVYGNPVGSVAVIACAQRGPGLVARILASRPQEHERGAGG